MSLLSSATVLRLVDSMAIVLAQAYQLARARLASAASPIVRLLVQRDQEATEGNLLRREVEVFRTQREGLHPRRSLRQADHAGPFGPDEVSGRDTEGTVGRQARCRC